MASYVISDIHGEYDKFIELLERVGFCDEDILYVIGDVVDRGPHPIKTLLTIMDMHNVVYIVGNHEFMALESLEFYMANVPYAKYRKKIYFGIETWSNDWGRTTFKEFLELDFYNQQRVVDYMKKCLLYKQIEVNNRKCILVHGGFQDFTRKKSLDDYTLHELIWTIPNYDKPYFDDIFVVAGHNPTQRIIGNSKPGYIYRNNNHIAIDCGACYEGGRLALLCLDTNEEYYAE